MIRSKKEVKKQFALAQEMKKQENWEDTRDKWAMFGYIHGLGFALGILKQKYTEKELK